jgi:hypothetical protein
MSDGGIVKSPGGWWMNGKLTIKIMDSFILIISKV